MPRPSPVALALLLVAPCLPIPSAAAHGGVYAPPPGGGSGGKTGLPVPGSPGAPAPGPGSPLGPASPGGLGAGEVDRTRWTWWWQHHRAGYLDLKRHLERDAPTTGGGDGGGTRVPGARELEERVLPTLLAVLARERSNDLLSSAMIAAARVADDLAEEHRERVAGALRPFLRDPTREISEAAALALGILGHEASAPLLAALVSDGDGARAILGKEAAPTRLRAFAALSLGLLAGASEREDVRRYAVHALAREIERERPAPPAELEAACVLALGLVPLDPAGDLDGDAVAPPAAGREAQIRFLERLLEDRRRADLVRAQVPLSLARLAAAERAPAPAALRAEVERALCARLVPMRREPAGVVQSAVVGLGLLADAGRGSAATRLALLRFDSDHSDQGARRFARIALARAGARPGDGDGGEADVRRFLSRELGRGRSEERAWAALALGVLERGRLDRGAIPDASVASALRTALGDARSPDEVGAAAVALGLMRDVHAEDVLRAQLRRVNEDEARGQLALALGMVGARDAARELKALVSSSLYRPLVLREAAIGLALLGEPETLPWLVARLEEARALASRAALAQAIGLVGDARAFEPLCALIGDRGVADGARAFAAVALGLAADRDPLPWSVPLAQDGNHLSAPSTLYDDVGLGVLNLL